MGLETLEENWRGAEYRLDKGVADKAIGDEAVEGSCSCEGVSEGRWAAGRGVTTVLRGVALSAGAH